LEGDVFTSFLSHFLRFLCGDKNMLKMEEHVTATREKIWLLNGELRFLLLTLFLVLCYTAIRSSVSLSDGLALRSDVLTFHPSRALGFSSPVSHVQEPLNLFLKNRHLTPFPFLSDSLTTALKSRTRKQISKSPM
jgi:hypothetical protein